MFGNRIKIDDVLFERLKKTAELAGYASTDEFILHTLEKTVAELESAETEEEVRKRLQGLGYLD